MPVKYKLHMKYAGRQLRHVFADTGESVSLTGKELRKTIVDQYGQSKTFVYPAATTQQLEGLYNIPLVDGDGVPILVKVEKESAAAEKAK